MPEKGWSSVTIRERLAKRLLEEAKRAKLSINDYIESKLTGQGLTMTGQVSEAPRQPHSREKTPGYQLKEGNHG